MKALLKALTNHKLTAAITLLIFLSIFSFYGCKKFSTKALFTEPYQICKRENPSFYHQISYDTKEYTQDRNKPESGESKFTTKADQGEIPEVDGGSRDQVNAAMQKRVGDAPESLALARLRYKTVYKDRQPCKQLQIISPEDNSLYPPNLCAPIITWEDPNNQLWQVVIEIPEKKLSYSFDYHYAYLDSGRPIEIPEKKLSYSFITETKEWRIPKNIWELLKKEAVDQDALLSIKGVRFDKKGKKSGDTQCTEPTRFRISKDPADDFIVYRQVAPPFSSFKTPDIYVRDIREDKPEMFLSARREYCMNCHTFSSKNGNTGKLALQIRSLVKVENNLRTYLAIYDFDKKSGYKVRLPFEIQMTTFMGWSPDGKQLAYSANQNIAALKPVLFETQLAGMATSDIAIYDTEKNETFLVPGASDPNMLEIYPQWTPDGKQLIFSRSPVGQHPAHIIFDLCIMDMNEKEPKAHPIEGASGNGRSNYFPHFSPDRKWFSFCQSDGGDLIRASSNIYIKKGDLSGPSSKLECNVDTAADSWHSWSSNSRWLVFASKRESGIYAYLYLTHISEDGHASPAIPLPLIEKPLASYNIPEFVIHKPTVREEELFEAIRVEPKPREVKIREISKGGDDGQEKSS